VLFLVGRRLLRLFRSLGVLHVLLLLQALLLLFVLLGHFLEPLLLLLLNFLLSLLIRVLLLELLLLLLLFLLQLLIFLVLFLLQLLVLLFVLLFELRIRRVARARDRWTVGIGPRVGGLIRLVRLWLSSVRGAAGRPVRIERSGAVIPSSTLLKVGDLRRPLLCRRSDPDRRVSLRGLQLPCLG